MLTFKRESRWARLSFYAMIFEPPYIPVRRLGLSLHAKLLGWGFSLMIHREIGSYIFSLGHQQWLDLGFTLQLPAKWAETRYFKGNGGCVFLTIAYQHFALGWEQGFYARWLEMATKSRKAHNHRWAFA